jgi:hypothetical protein
MKRIAPALILVATAAILYRKAIRLWWLYDDVWLVHVVLARRWTMAFTDGDTWHRTFTPLLDSTYEVLLAVAGMDTRWWHVVELALLAFCAVSIHLVLTLYARASSAFAGAFLFLIGAPLCAFATQLNLINVLEGLACAALSVALFVTASRRKSNLLNVLSATMYFIGVLADRAILALPLLLLMLPERTWRVRARHLVFHAIAFAGLFVWRGRVLGFKFSGPGWALDLRDIPVVLATVPWKVLMVWLGAGIEVGIVAVVLMAIGAGQLFRTRRASMLLFGALALAVVPIVLVTKDVGPRLAMPAWLWLCALFALGLSRFKPLTAQVLAVATASALLVANRQQWGAEFGLSQRMTDEAHAFMDIDGASMLRTPAIPPGAMTELKWLKEEYFRRALGSGWFYDDLYLCGAQLHGRRVYEYHEDQREVVEVTSRIPDYARVYCARIRDQMPMRTEFHYRKDTLFWSFGPYDEGTWRVVLGGGVQAFDVPARDGFSLPGLPGLGLRVKYQSPAVWVTYSPDLVLDFVHKPEMVWER